MYIFIHLFFYSGQVSLLFSLLLWRYWGDILLFASVPVASLWGAAPGRGLAPLIPELEAPGPSGPVAAVEALRVTFARRPALLALPAALAVLALLLLVCRAAAGARLLRLVHTQLTQGLARRGARRGRGRRGRVLRGPLAHLGVAELTGLLKRSRGENKL